MVLIFCSFLFAFSVHLHEVHDNHHFQRTPMDLARMISMRKVRRYFFDVYSRLRGRLTLYLPVFLVTSSNYEVNPIPMHTPAKKGPSITSELVASQQARFSRCDRCAPSVFPSLMSICVKLSMNVVVESLVVR